MIREERRKKRKKAWILNIILAVMIVLVIIAIAIVMVFRVKEVKIEGNELYDDETIKQWVLDDEYSINTLYVYLKYKFVKPKERPFIDTLEVSMENPQTLIVTVYEKGMIGYIYQQSEGMYYYFDKDGIVIERSDQLISNVSKVTGLSYKNLSLYEKIDVKNKNVFNFLLTVTQDLEKYELVPDEINLAEDGSMVLKFGLVTVNFGEDENTEEKIIRLKKILPKLDGKSGTLYMENWSSESSNIIFRKS